MAPKSKFVVLEEKRGKPLPEILIEELSKHETVAEAAAALHISYRYVKEKIDELGLEKQPARWTRPEGDHAE